MQLTAQDRRAIDKIRQLSRDTGIDISAAKIRRTSSRFCLGVEHGDYNGTELFGVGTDRFIWVGYRPNGTDKVRLLSGNFPTTASLNLRSAVFLSRNRHPLQTPGGVLPTGSNMF